MQLDVQSPVPASRTPLPAVADDITGDELPAGTELGNGQYVIERYLNCGGFGITYLARDSLGRKVVIKECFPNAICCRSGRDVRLRSQTYEVDFNRAVSLFQKEARTLAQLDHPNIVGVHHIFEANGTAYMALDFVEGTDLLDLLEQHPEVRSPEALRELSVTLLHALCYVHDSGVLHRDISPDNVILDPSGTPVLIDFGAARQSATQASRILSRVYTVKDGYSPQEFYIAGSTQSPASDLYALAATFYHLIAGTPPPNSSLRLAAVAEQRDDPYEQLLGKYPAYESALLATIDGCMSLFARDRLPSAQAWLDRLNGTAEPAGQGHPAPADLSCQIAALVEENQMALVTPDPAPAAPEPESPQPAQPDRDYWAILNEQDGIESAPRVAEPDEMTAHRSWLGRWLGWIVPTPRKHLSKRG